MPSLMLQQVQLTLALQDLLLPPVQATLGSGPQSDLAAINDELTRLRQGRDYFMAWVEQFRAADPADRRGLSPWAFLQAWNDSTARIIYLMRERRNLAGHKDTEFDPIMEAVFDQLEQHRGVQALNGVADPNGTSSPESSPSPPAEGTDTQ